MAVLRIAATVIVLLALYYLLPLQRLADIPLAVSLVLGVAVLTTVASLEIRSVVRADDPFVRALEALARFVPAVPHPLRLAVRRARGH